MLIIRFFLALLLCFLPFPLAVFSAAPSAVSASDGRWVSGSVFGSDGDALAGATVSVVGTNLSVGTNAKGEFRLRVKGRSAIVLRVSHVGFRSLEHRLLPTSSSDGLRLVLTASLSEIGEAVVTGSRTERLLKDVPVITRVIGRAEIDRISPMDMQQLLQYALPGIQFTYNMMSQNLALNYQGMGSKMLLFLVDGERMSGEGSDHNIDFARINPDEVERIEVVRGAASTLYDSNAQGGVINIITRRASRPLSLNAYGRIGGSGEKYGASLGFKRSRFSSFTTLGHRHRNTFFAEDDKYPRVEVRDSTGAVRDTLLPSSTRVPIYGYSIWDVSQRLIFRPIDRLSLEGKASYYNNFRHDMLQGLRRDRYEDLTLTFRANYRLRQGQQLELTGQTDTYLKHQFFRDNGEHGTPYANRQQELRLNYTADFAHHSLSLGVEGLHESLRHYMLPDSGTMGGWRGSAYAQEEVALLRNLKVVVGLRADRAYGFSLHLTPKASVLYRPVAPLSLRLNVSEGYRPPTLKERYQEFIYAMNILGNPDLKPETSRQLSASAEWTREGLNLSASVFHNRYRNYISYMSVNSNTLRYINTDNRETTGCEISARWQERWLLLSGSYNFIDDNDMVGGYSVSTVRPHTLTFGASVVQNWGRNLRLSAALNGHWGARFSSYIVERNQIGYRKYTYPTRTYLSLNIGVQLPQRGVQLYVLVDNILDYRDKAGNATTQMPDAGRSFSLGCSINVGDLLKF